MGVVHIVIQWLRIAFLLHFLLIDLIIEVLRCRFIEMVVDISVDGLVRIVGITRGDVFIFMEYSVVLLGIERELSRDNHHMSREQATENTNCRFKE